MTGEPHDTSGEAPSRKWPEGRLGKAKRRGTEEGAVSGEDDDEEPSPSPSPRGGDKSALPVAEPPLGEGGAGTALRGEGGSVGR